MLGKYKVRAAHLKHLHRRALALPQKFASIQMQHVNRRHNQEADALANKAIQRKLARKRAAGAGGR